MKNAALAHFVIALLVLFVVGGVYLFVFNETGRLKQEIRDVALVIIQKTTEQEKAVQLKDSQFELEQDEARISRYFIETDKIVEFLESIEASGAEFGADVAVVSVGDPVDGRVTLALSIIGTFDAVMKTVARIEYGIHASATKSLTLDKIDEGLWSAALTFSVITDSTP